MKEYDVLIVGGGPAGSTLASCLAASNFSVLLLEGDDFSKPRVGETLSASIKLELQRLGWWDDFLALHPKSCYGIESTWNEQQASFKSHILNPLGNSWHVNRAKFDALLFDKARKKTLVNAFFKSRLTSIQQLPNDQWQFSWRSPQGEKNARARIYVQATGRKSSTQNKDKVSYRMFDQLVGIGVILSVCPQELKHLIVKAAELGWWYAAPLTDGQSVLYLMTDLDIVKERQLSDFENWKYSLPNDHPLFEEFRSLLPPHQKLLIKQAHSQIIQQVHVNNFFTVGDALVSFDPLTGLGVTRAIQTATGVARWLPHQTELNPKSCHTFLNQLKPLFHDYLQQWLRTYSIVDIWDTSLFWKRRHEMIVS